MRGLKLIYVIDLERGFLTSIKSSGIKTGGNSLSLLRYESSSSFDYDSKGYWLDNIYYWYDEYSFNPSDKNLNI